MLKKNAQKCLPESGIWHVMQSMPNSSHVLSGLLSSIVTQVRISSISFDQDVKDFLMIKLTCQVQRSVASMRPNVGVGSVLARLKCKCKQLKNVNKQLKIVFHIPIIWQGQDFHVCKPNARQCIRKWNPWLWPTLDHPGASWTVWCNRIWQLPPSIAWLLGQEYLWMKNHGRSHPGFGIELYWNS